MARIRTSTVRGITWRSHQSKNNSTPWNRTLLREANTRTTFEMGRLADNVEVGYPGYPGERDRKTRNEQLKNAWLNCCQKIELVGILCGDKPREVL